MSLWKKAPPSTNLFQILKKGRWWWGFLKKSCFNSGEFSTNICHAHLNQQCYNFLDTRVWLQTVQWTEGWCRKNVPLNAASDSVEWVDLRISELPLISTTTIDITIVILAITIETDIAKKFKSRACADLFITLGDVVRVGVSKESALYEWSMRISRNLQRESKTWEKVIFYIVKWEVLSK